jgi:hypothetical protein
VIEKTWEEKRKEKRLLENTRRKSTKAIDRLCKKKSPEHLKTPALRLTHVRKRSGMSVTCGAAPARKYDVA